MKSACAASSSCRRSRCCCVLNLGEADAARLREIEENTARTAGRQAEDGVTAICGKIEAELAELPRAEARGVPGELRAARNRAWSG